MLLGCGAVVKVPVYEPAENCDCVARVWETEKEAERNIEIVGELDLVGKASEARDGSVLILELVIALSGEVCTWSEDE